MVAASPQYKSDDARRSAMAGFPRIVSPRGRCPEGADRELAIGKRVGKCVSRAENESTAFPHGEDSETRTPSYPHQSLPRVGKVASEASRIGF